LWLRVTQITFWFAVAFFCFPIFLVRRRSFRGGLGAAVAFLFRRLGATFIKIGQIVSTRPDLFPPQFLAPLIELQDRVPPFAFRHVRKTIEGDFGCPLESIFSEFNPMPVASGSVAQVHRAALLEAPPGSPRIVAVKVRRPAIVRRAYLDEAILSFGAHAISLIPTVRLISPIDAVNQFCDAVNKQLDFRLEAENNRRFREQFANDPQIVFPSLVDRFCSDSVLTMEYVHGVKDDQILAIGNDPAFHARHGMDVISRMIYLHGFVHADLHPGNIFYLPGNRIALIDLGLVAELNAEDRRKLATLHFFMAAGLGRQAAKVLYDEAPWKAVVDYAAFERDVADFIDRNLNQPLATLQVTYLIGELFNVMRRHRLRVDPAYTVVNLAMMVAEGLGRRLDPMLDPTLEVRPFLEVALGLRASISHLSPPQTGVLPEGRKETGRRPLQLSIAAGRYRIERFVGEGSLKLVYQGRDNRLEREVAIAFLKAEALDPADIARIHAEARSMARLGDHASIVGVYDAGEENGRPFIISEFMAGGAVDDLQNRSPDRRLSVDKAIEIAEQLCGALAHAHSRGIIHRDLKPANVWLTDEGKVKLGDFGLATGPIDTSSATGTLVGTLAYVSPEQIVGGAIDGRSDLYSLGAMLYEMVTGRPPFVADSAAALLSQHTSSRPSAPSTIADGLPAALDRLVLQLLAKSPADRPQDAGAVMTALEQIKTDVAAAHATPNETRREPAVSTFFVGRSEELKRITAGLEAALSGRGRLFLLAGEPGIGKTRTAEQIASLAQARGARSLVGRCYEGEGAPAYWPWVQIVRSYAEGCDDERLRMELGPGGPDIAQVVTDLRDRFPDLPPPPQTDAEQARFRLFDYFARFLKNAARHEPLCILLDDIHWADKSSLLLLHFLSREMTESRILVLGTYRDVEVRHGHPLSEVLPSIRRERVYERILLRGLPEKEVRDFLSSFSGEQVSTSFARAIFSETEGNPLYVEEILKYLGDEGLKASTGPGVRRLEELGLPESIREVIGRRLGRLSEPCRRLLSLAAVMGRHFDAGVLERVAESPRDNVLDNLDEACDARVIIENRATQGVFSFSHALVRDTLYEELRPTERLKLHKKIGEVLEHLPGSADSRLSELAYHFGEAARGGDAKKAVTYAVRAGDEALSRLAFEESAAQYQRALDTLELDEQPDQRARCETLIKLGDAITGQANLSRARPAYLQATELAEKAHDAELFARAVLGLGSPIATFDVGVGALDKTWLNLVDKGLKWLPDEDSLLC
jgi:predicted unusual protein kinase regulating ubiquinone biosynthesis (AarF/ABC1/UbiB family)